jgi:hypothetical protein
MEQEELIRRFRCAGCGGIWQMLPLAIARRLHRTWEAVQSAVTSGRAVAPARTVRRWRARLALSAWLLVQVLASAAEEVVADSQATRGELVDILADTGAVSSSLRFAETASWVHRVRPGVRLM